MGGASSRKNSSLELNAQGGDDQGGKRRKGNKETGIQGWDLSKELPTMMGVLSLRGGPDLYGKRNLKMNKRGKRSK